MKKFIFILGLLLISLNVNAQFAQRWVSRFNTTYNNDDEPSKIICDKLGNIIVTGYSTPGLNQKNIATIKYNPSGNVVWQNFYNKYTGSPFDVAFDVIADNNNNIYVLGVSYFDNKMEIIKYNPNGIQQWVVFDTVGSGGTITTDIYGNIYTTFSSRPFINYDIATSKFNSNGVKLWTKIYNGTGNGDDGPSGILVDKSGNIYVTGKSTGIENNFDFITIKYNSSGDTLWTRRYNGPGNGDDAPGGIKMDKQGYIYVGGYSFINATYDFELIKYDSNGVFKWRSEYAGSGGSSDYCTEIAIDSLNNNIYLFGTIFMSSHDYIGVVKFNSNGTRIWWQAYPDIIYRFFNDFHFSIDSIGNSYITGATGSLGNSTCFVEKFDTSANISNYLTYVGTANGDNRPRGITVFSKDIFFITCFTGSSALSYDHDWATIRYSTKPTAVINNFYIPNNNRQQYCNVPLSDSLCIGQIDSTFWFINDSLVSKQHSVLQPFKQGTNKLKIIVKDKSGYPDTANSLVTCGTWKRFTNGSIYAGLSLIGDSVLYAVSTGDKVYKMDINGNTAMTIQVAGNILSSCSVGYDTSIFIGSSDNNLYGFNRWGFPIWPAIPLGGPISATPTVDSLSNRIYVGVENGNFAAINKSSGTIAWGIQLGSPIKNSAVISFNRKLVCISSTGILYGFNLNIPTPLPPNWTLNLNDSVLVSPCVDTSGNFYFGSRSGKIYKVALTGTNTSTILWQTQLDSAVTSSPTIDANGNIYVGTKSGRLYSINRNGGIRWYFQSPGQIKSTAAITPTQRVHFGNDAGEIYGLDTNKNIQFYYIDSAKISCAMLYNKGTLYFGNEAGRLFALYDTTAETYNKIGNGTPIWGTFQNNVRRTGEQDNVTSPPLAPILLSPLNGTTGISLTPLLDWNDAPFASSYRVQISTSILFGATVFDTSGVNVSQVTVPTGKLNYNTLYYWRVYSQNSSGISTWSSIWNFTTAQSAPPPQLISPLNNSILIPLTPILSWGSVVNALSYKLQVSTNSGFTTTILDSTLYTTAISIPVGLLGSVQTYYWRVATTNATGQGNYSAPWSFTTRNNFILNLTVFLEGFWDGASMISDTARVYIANPVSPYNFVDSAAVMLSTTGTATAIFNIPPNGNYYVVIIHRNHLETWSGLSQTFMTDIPVNYNFTTSSSQAYGNNMKQIGSVWVLYGGDPNQDGSIDGLDIPIFISQFGTQGYLSCDFNGDGDVNALDVQIIVSNFGLTKASPTLEPMRKKENGKKESGKKENGKMENGKTENRKTENGKKENSIKKNKKTLDTDKR